MDFEITDVTTHHVVQGTPEWHALRATVDGTASEAPAMMGDSSKLTRSQLLTAKATGITKEVSDYVQRFLFDRGHELEKAFLPHAEAIVEDELFPVTVTAVVDGIRLLASCDGATMGGDTLFEHKMLNAALIDYIDVNGEPDMERVWQLEQQLLVTGAERVLLAVGDGTKDGTRTAWYESKPERRKALILGWKVFMEDLAAWTPEQAVELPKLQAAPVEKLPAIVVDVSGEISVGGNLEQWRAIAERWLEAAPRADKLETDQDFVDADAFAKECSSVEAKLQLVKDQALAQAAPLETLVKTLDEISEKVRAVRLANERAVKLRKDNIKMKAIADAQVAFTTYVETFNRGFGQRLMPTIPVDFAGAAKNKRTMESLRNAIATELSRAKVVATDIANTISTNMRAIVQAGSEASGLFPDLAAVCTKAPEDFEAVLQLRLSNHRAAIQKAADEAAHRARQEAEAVAAAASAAAAASSPRDVPVSMGAEDRVAPHRTAVTRGSQAPAAEPAMTRHQTPLHDLDALIDEFMDGTHYPPMVRGTVRAALIDWESFKSGHRMAA